MGRKNLSKRISNKRKINGAHIIITKKDGNNIVRNVKSFATPKEMLSDIILNTENYPPGNYGYKNG